MPWVPDICWYDIDSIRENLDAIERVVANLDVDEVKKKFILYKTELEIFTTMKSFYIHNNPKTLRSEEVDEILAILDTFKYELCIKCVLHLDSMNNLELMQRISRLDEDFNSAMRTCDVDERIEFAMLFYSFKKILGIKQIFDITSADTTCKHECAYNKYLAKLPFIPDINWLDIEDIRRNIIKIEYVVLTSNDVELEKNFLQFKIELGIYIQPKSYSFANKIFNTNEINDVNCKLYVFNMGLGIKLDLDLSDISYKDQFLSLERTFNDSLKKVDVQTRKKFATLFYDLKQTLGVTPIFEVVNSFSCSNILKIKPVREQATKTKMPLMELAYILKSINCSIDMKSMDECFVSYQMNNIKNVITYLGDGVMKEQWTEILDEIDLLVQKVKCVLDTVSTCTRLNAETEVVQTRKYEKEDVLDLYEYSLSRSGTSVDLNLAELLPPEICRKKLPRSPLKKYNSRDCLFVEESSKTTDKQLELKVQNYFPLEYPKHGTLESVFKVSITSKLRLLNSLFMTDIKLNDEYNVFIDKMRYIKRLAIKKQNNEVEMTIINSVNEVFNSIVENRLSGHAIKDGSDDSLKKGLKLNIDPNLDERYPRFHNMRL